MGDFSIKYFLRFLTLRKFAAHIIRGGIFGALPNMPLLAPFSLCSLFSFLRYDKTEISHNIP